MLCLLWWCGSISAATMWRLEELLPFQTSVTLASILHYRTMTVPTFSLQFVDADIAQKVLDASLYTIFDSIPFLHFCLITEALDLILHM